MELTAGRSAASRVIAPIAINKKSETSCTKWMSRTHQRPCVSSIDRARIQPRNHASPTPTSP
jgi:heme O synthase-like polyprenyltransferase